MQFSKKPILYKNQTCYQCVLFAPSTIAGRDDNAVGIYLMKPLTDYVTFYKLDGEGKCRLKLDMDLENKHLEMKTLL